MPQVATNGLHNLRSSNDGDPKADNTEQRQSPSTLTDDGKTSSSTSTEVGSPALSKFELRVQPVSPSSVPSARHDPFFIPELNMYLWLPAAQTPVGKPAAHDEKLKEAQRKLTEAQRKLTEAQRKLTEAQRKLDELEEAQRKLKEELAMKNKKLADRETNLANLVEQMQTQLNREAPIRAQLETGAAKQQALVAQMQAQLELDAPMRVPLETEATKRQELAEQLWAQLQKADWGAEQQG